jgi:hypothetical protein
MGGTFARQAAEMTVMLYLLQVNVLVAIAILWPLFAVYLVLMVYGTGH